MMAEVAIIHKVKEEHGWMSNMAPFRTIIQEEVRNALA